MEQKENTMNKENSVDFKKLTMPLDINEIDFRIQSINRGGYAVLLAYKDARADIRRLNSVAGHLNWKREHKRENKNCVVSIYDVNKNEWVSKEDTGTESYSDKEKGLASDSFKRACFNWGIGAELYDYPLINIKLNKNEKGDRKGEWFMDGDKPKQGYGLNLRDWVWCSEFLEGQVSYLSVKDEFGKLRFEFGITKDLKEKAELRERIKIINSDVNKDINTALKDAGFDTPQTADEFCQNYKYDLAKIRNKLNIINSESLDVQA